MAERKGIPSKYHSDNIKDPRRFTHVDRWVVLLSPNCDHYGVLLLSMVEEYCGEQIASDDVMWWDGVEDMR